MQSLKAAITGVFGYVPDYILTNKELETMVDTNDEWIESRTGIKERRILKEEGKATSDMGVEAVKGLLKKKGIAPEEIELVIVATVTPDMLFPDTANIIADKCGMKNAFGFDLSAACSGFLFALTTGVQFISSGMYKKVIVIGADKMSSIIDYTDRATCVIFGDGAGAVLLEPSTDENGFQDAILKGDGSGRDILHMKAGGSLKPATTDTVANREHYIYQEGRAVFKKAVKGMISASGDLISRNGMTVDDVDWVVPHQANIRIINSVADGLNCPMDKVLVNINKFGNTTAATIPLCLWDFENKLEKGQNVVLTAFGGGLTWGAIYLKWAI